MTEKKPANLKAIKNLIRGSRNPFQLVSRIRGELNPGDYEPFIEWLDRITFHGRPLFAGSYAKRLRDLHAMPMLGKIATALEIAWAGYFLAHRAARLCAFVNMARKYEGALLAGKYEECLKLLDEIERQFGSSLWVIESRIAALQIAYGLEHQKAYLARVRETCGETNIVSFIAFYLSQTNEPIIKPDAFKAQIAEQLSLWCHNNDLRTYLSFRLASVTPVDAAGISSILRHEGTSSVVDYYDTFLRLAQAAINDPDTHMTNAFEKAFVHLHCYIPDPRIDKLLFLSTTAVRSLTNVRLRSLGPMDALVAGRYLETVDDKYPVDRADISFWLAGAEARTEAGLALPEASSLGARLASLAQQAALPREDVDKPIIDLERLASTLRLTTFSATLRQWVTENMHPNPLPHKPSGLKAFLESEYLEPAALSHIDNREKRAAYRDLLLKHYGSGSYVTSALVFANEESVLEDRAPSVLFSAPMSLHVQIMRSLQTKTYKEALQSAQSLRSVAGRRYWLISYRYEAYCLLELGYAEVAIDLVVSLCLADQSLVTVLPLRSCVERLDKPTRKLLAGKLSTPIVLDLYSRFLDDRFENLLSFA